MHTCGPMPSAVLLCVALVPTCRARSVSFTTKRSSAISSSSRKLGATSTPSPPPPPAMPLVVCLLMLRPPRLVSATPAAPAIALVVALVALPGSVLLDAMLSSDRETRSAERPTPHGTSSPSPLPLTTIFDRKNWLHNAQSLAGS